MSAAVGAWAPTHTGSPAPQSSVRALGAWTQCHPAAQDRGLTSWALVVSGERQAGTQGVMTRRAEVRLVLELNSHRQTNSNRMDLRRLWNWGFERRRWGRQV